MARRTKKAPEEPPQGPYRTEFETFRKPGLWTLREMTQDQPTCFNGVVSIRKYRVTVEEIEEPKEVLEARLRELWAECDNHHYWAPLERAAKALGIELSHDERRV